MINAARTLAARPRSRAARENMDVFKTSWETQVHLLVDAVDEITGIDEFLIVSGKFHTITKRLLNQCYTKQYRSIQELINHVRIGRTTSFALRIAMALNVYCC